MHYIHTVRTYIFTSIYLGIYILSVCLSIPKVRYNISFFFLFLFFLFYTNSGVPSFSSFLSPSLLLFSSFPGR